MNARSDIRDLYRELVGAHGAPLVDKCVLAALTRFKTRMSGPGNRVRDGIDSQVAEIIDDLNAVIGKGYRHGIVATETMIRARLAEGFTVEDFRLVHRHKAAEWLADPKWRKYLRPMTLYRPSHFETYLQDATDWSNATGKSDPGTPDPVRKPALRDWREFVLPATLYNYAKSLNDADWQRFVNGIPDDLRPYAVEESWDIRSYLDAYRTAIDNTVLTVGPSGESAERCILNHPGGFMKSIR